MMKLFTLKSARIYQDRHPVWRQCLVENYARIMPGLVVLDLARPLPHLDAFTIAGFFTHQTYAVKLSSPLFRLRNNW
ncbi:hypothetical protein ACSF3M_10805 [Klebsiella quasipneumoniae]|uniref:hypothetical protein n=1 Tax=Klebsiella quasipneumoniae TaxID=1463165 RepID=UPI003F478240